MKSVLFLLLLIFTSSSVALAQEFEIKKYDLTARVDAASQTLNVEARLEIYNLSSRDLLDKLLLAGEDKPRLTFFLNPKATASKVQVNGADVPFKSGEDTRNNLIRISTDITSAIASVREFNVALSYSIFAADRGPHLRISAGETFVLPPSFWFPVIHTPFGDHGADTAPFTLNVTPPAGHKVISSGIRKNDTSFEQSLAALPFFITGEFDLTTRGAASAPVEVWAHAGTGDIGKRQIDALASEAERASAFCTKYFNQPATAPFRIVTIAGFGLTAVAGEGVSQSRDSNYASTGILLLDDHILRRDVLDTGTIELLTGTIAKAWIDGKVLLRGRGSGFLRDALPIYLAASYLAERNGPAEQEAAFEGYRRAYAPLARGSDAPLFSINSLDRNYTTSMYSKGSLVWRLLEKQIGRQSLDQLVRSMLDRQRVDVLSLIEWRAPLCTVARCANVKALLLSDAAKRTAVNELFAQWIETVTVPDFAIGQPQKNATGWESTVVNFGSGDFTVLVVAINEKGEKLEQRVSVKGGEYGTVSFPGVNQITAIEVDPEKIYIQKDYANDAFPRRVSASDLFGQANQAFSKNDFATAESKMREAVRANPASSSLEAFLGRILLAQNKNDEAAKIFDGVLKNKLITLQAYAWAHLGLGTLLAAQKKPADAAAHFRLAAAADLDAATTVAARNGALAAEREAGTIAVPEDAKAFLRQFDAAVLQGGADSVNPLVDMGNLRRFAQSLVVRKPNSWTSEALRIENWDANRVAVDVSLKIRVDNRDHTGRAVYVLRKTQGKLILSEVPAFDVK
jgi:Tetratricopeptide repeat